jgi:hypothetical protein
VNKNVQFEDFKAYDILFDQKRRKDDEWSDSDSEKLQFYDAVDHMIVEELEKSMQQDMIKHRETVMILDDQRNSLPALKPKSNINIFKILKDSIGKDLTKF